MATDVLSEVRLTGSAFFNVTAVSPWVAEAPPSAQIADAVKLGAQHAIEYHAINRGSCWISSSTSPSTRLSGRRQPSSPCDRMCVERPGWKADPDVTSHRRAWTK